ncbi:MAG TPA: histidine phosphatase family protein, partial [Leptospiraceae bacterium]|nr:histidine phosphatase family protein [Leptospiraceae bacterium]
KQVLSNLGSTENFTCYSSPLERCRVLANSISTSPILEKRLMEMNFGDWENKSWDEIGKTEFDQWHSDFVKNHVPNGESYFELYTRSISFLNEILLENKNSILVTHGGVIRAILAHTLGLPLENSFRLKIEYGSISKIQVTNQISQVEFVNISADYHR